MHTENVDRKWLTEVTGDPFADTGGRVIDFLWHLPQFKHATIMDLVRFMADIYINEWGGNVYAFFLNSPVTQAAYTEYEWDGHRYSPKEIKKMHLTDEQKKQAKREDKKIIKTVDYYQSIVDETEPHKTGFCEISGQKTKLFMAGRDNQILSGSSTFVNFHALLQDGLYVSKEMLLRQFFVPFGVQGVGGKETLIMSNSWEVNNFFVHQNCLHNLDALNNSSSKGPLRSSFSHPSSALFSFIDHYTNELIDTLNKTGTGPTQVSLHMYHFNNGKTPEIKVYHLDAMVFSFYMGCLNNDEFKDSWIIFQQNHYDPKNIKNLTFNEQDRRWEKKGVPILFEEFANWKNLILHALLHNIPLVEYFYNWGEKGKYLPWGIVKYYLIMIQKMQSEGIDLISRLTDFILDHSDDQLKKDIAALKNVASIQDFRIFLNKLQERAYAEKNQKGIFSPEEYSDYLLPDNKYSRTRDLFLISIYQKSIVK